MGNTPQHGWYWAKIHVWLYQWKPAWRYSHHLVSAFKFKSVTNKSSGQNKPYHRIYGWAYFPCTSSDAQKKTLMENLKQKWKTVFARPLPLKWLPVNDEDAVLWAWESLKNTSPEHSVLSGIQVLYWLNGSLLSAIQNALWLYRQLSMSGMHLTADVCFA